MLIKCEGFAKCLLSPVTRPFRTGTFFRSSIVFSIACVIHSRLPMIFTLCFTRVKICIVRPIHSYCLSQSSSRCLHWHSFGLFGHWSIALKLDLTTFLPSCPIKPSYHGTPLYRLMTGWRYLLREVY